MSVSATQHPAADQFLGEVEAWTGATKRTAAELGAIVLNHGGFIPLLRKRGTLKPETAARVRAFMAAFPDAASLPKQLAAELKEEARSGGGWTVERHRSLAAKYGFPGGVPKPTLETPPEVAVGGKPRVSAAVQRACLVDGRDLVTFVTALIDMGLECWRDDRQAHGEPIA
ncbi:hypothetical protein [uncultured Sphingomonas sp.]|uniref:hypothetical protein n=1 Tax=uncultured Sphingomonas sp. TaxID=158754 RepID=UPI0026008024|nr:hypothetical protein [uncultured Sphingomonas sp.]